MSHATVLVISQTLEEIDDLLAPYEKELEVPRYVEYTKKQLIRKEKQKIKQYQKGIYAKFLKDKKAYKQDCKNEAHIKYLEKEFPKELKMNDEQLYKKAIKWYDKEQIGKKGEVYSTSNPKAKWDWYIIGGRWGNTFKLKKGKSGKFGGRSFLSDRGYKEGYADQAKKGDIDFKFMENDKEELKAYEDNWNKTVIDKKGWESPEYYLKRYGTKENYIKEQMQFSTFAVLDKNGWYEAGKLGWWGMDSGSIKDHKKFKQTYFDRFLKDLPNNMFLTIVDYHI